MSVSFDMSKARNLFTWLLAFGFHFLFAVYIAPIFYMIGVLSAQILATILILSFVVAFQFYLMHIANILWSLSEEEYFRRIFSSRA